MWYTAMVYVALALSIVDQVEQQPVQLDSGLLVVNFHYCFGLGVELAARGSGAGSGRFAGHWQEPVDEQCPGALCRCCII